MSEQKPRAYRRTNAFAAWRDQHADVLLVAGITCAMFAILVMYAGKKSFFSDELDQLGILVRCGSLRELLSLYASMEHEVAPPLFAIVAYGWYSLTPLSQRWLLILPAIAASIGVFCVGMSGRMLGGKRVAVLSALAACALPAMATTIGTQFRQYAFVFLFSSLIVFLYLRRLQRHGNERALDVVLYGIAMAGLPYSHYLSVFVCFFLFVLDAVLFMQKRIRLRCLWSYVIGAALFAPWGLRILPAMTRISSFWIPVPRVLDIVDALYYLTDAFSIFFVLYIAGLCAALVSSFRCNKEARPFDVRRTVSLAFAVAAPVMIAIVLIYSKFFSNGVSLFLPRYFICTLPMVLLTVSLFVDRMFTLFLAGKPVDAAMAQRAFLLTCAALCGISAWQNVHDYTADILEPYRESVEFLCTQPDIYDEDVAVLTSGESVYVTAGLNALYITRNGERPSFAVFDRVHPFTSADAQKYEKIYVMQIHASLPAESVRTLNERYELHTHFTEGQRWNVLYYARIGGSS